MSSATCSGPIGPLSSVPSPDRVISTSSRSDWSTTSPGLLSARANAWRRTAADTQSADGCIHAPRPGMVLATSTTTLDPPSQAAATTRTRSAMPTRCRHPRHIRIGPCGERPCEESFRRPDRLPPSELFPQEASGRIRVTIDQSSAPRAELDNRYSSRPAGSRRARLSGGRTRRARCLVGIRADVDTPARQARGQTRILALLADRE